MGNLKNISRKLRSNMTSAEVYFWQRIRKKQIKNLQFYRQKPLGKYIVDFYCPARKLIIEVDGGQHYDSGKLTEEDLVRENYLKNVLKYNVIRFTNTEIKQNMPAVIDRIIILL